MTATKLSLYNGALQRLGERGLSTVTDDVPERYHLDTIWDEDPIQHMLEKYIWNFALRTMEWNYNSAIEPDFGYQYVFDKPSDYVRLASLSQDEYLQYPLRNYEVDGDYFYCDYQTIYLKYVSNDSSYGKDYSKFTTHFEQMTATYLAQRLVLALNKSGEMKKELKADYLEMESEARNIDFFELPTRFPPQSSWARSRRWGSQGDSRRGPVIG
jgi:hypothetical protein